MILIVKAEAVDARVDQRAELLGVENEYCIRVRLCGTDELKIVKAKQIVGVELEPTGHASYEFTLKFNYRGHNEYVLTQR